MVQAEAETATVQFSEDFFRFGALSQKVAHIQLPLQKEMLTAIGHKISFMKRDPMYCSVVKTKGGFLYSDYAKLVYD